MITVRTLAGDDPLRFQVVVRDDQGETRHQVTMSVATFNAVAAGACTPEHCVEAAF